MSLLEMAFFLLGCETPFKETEPGLFSHIFKILEKVVLQQLNQLLDEYSIRDTYQTSHNTKTALLKVTFKNNALQYCVTP